MPDDVVSEEALKLLRASLEPLLDIQFELLKLPRVILKGFEPSQIGTMVGTLMDACIPQLSLILPDNAKLLEVGLEKHAGQIGEREAYPDYIHRSGLRVELKLLYVDPIEVDMKKPPTRREASARLTQKVTEKNVQPSKDVLLVLAYQLRPNEAEPDLFSPTVIDFGLFPVIKCVRARDYRLKSGGGRWFGNFETPAVLSRAGKRKKQTGTSLDESGYGRKESEGRDFNEDTNFGKLKRIPYEPLQRFLKKHGATYCPRGSYPAPWLIDNTPVEPD